MESIRLLVVLALLAPAVAGADRGALTVEAGGAAVLTRLDPSIGSGARVDGTLGSAVLGVRYALQSRLELHATAFWSAPARFVNRPVVVTTAAGRFDGDLRREVSRLGVGVGARYVLTGLVWRFPVGFEVGWVQTATRNQDLVPRPGGDSFVPLQFAGDRADRPYVAPFAGVEWQVSDHVSLSLLPRLEVPVGGGTAAVVTPLLLGWSWFLM
jgi:hypothetical protein